MIAGLITGVALAMVAPLPALAQSADDSFNPGANGSIHALTMQADGKILVGGDFTSIGGGVRNYIDRLNADGTLGDAFTPVANDRIRSRERYSSSDPGDEKEFHRAD